MNLKEWRKSKGWTQSQAAEALGVTRVTYARWELKNKPPRTAEILIAMLSNFEKVP